jgi:hypothetical protein
VQYSSLFHCNSGYKNAPQCYGIRKLPVLLVFITDAECLLRGTDYLNMFQVYFSLYRINLTRTQTNTYILWPKHWVSEFCNRWLTDICTVVITVRYRVKPRLRTRNPNYSPSKRKYRNGIPPIVTKTITGCFCKVVSNFSTCLVGPRFAPLYLENSPPRCAFPRYS